MLLLPTYEQVLTPITGSMTNPSMLKSTIMEIQQNSYIIDLVRQRKMKILVQHVYLTGARGAVVQRDGDILTPEEFKLYAQEVAASMLSELNLGSPKVFQSSQSCDGREHYRL